MFNMGLDKKLIMILRHRLPTIANKLDLNAMKNILKDGFSEVANKWFDFQMEWTNNCFETFKDHERYLIVISLVKKTLDFYQTNLVKMNINEFYSLKKIEIEEIKIIEISKTLNIPKETVRRKVKELEKNGAIQKYKKKYLIKPKVYPIIKPEMSIKKVSDLVYHISKILKKNNIINDVINIIEAEEYLKKNFTITWKYFYELQIAYLLNWKYCFKDLETWHIFGTCVYNQSKNIKKNPFLKPMNNLEYLKNIATVKGKGINAMSISDITNIPRPTVIRKLNKLVKLKFLRIDKNKLYSMTLHNLNLVMGIHEKQLILQAVFFTKIINLVLVNKK